MPTHCEGIPVAVWNDYYRYLVFKKMDRRGEVSRPTGKYRSTYFYWMKKLTSRGWAERLPDNSFKLKSYQTVWELMGAKKTTRPSSNTLGYQFTKLDFLYDPEATPRARFRRIKSEIRETVVIRKNRQITRRLLTGRGINLQSKTLMKRAAQQIQSTYQPKLSCKAVANLFGYKSTLSGWLHYDTYFERVANPKKYRILGVKGLYHYRYECNQFRLRFEF